MADKEFTVGNNTDNLKLVEIDSADTIAEMVKKINDNFTNIAAHGGGPQGLKGDKGEDGIDGKAGKDGTGINLKASQADCTEIGDSYMAEDGHLWMFTGDGFKDLGAIKGEQGEKGEKGADGKDGKDGTGITVKPSKEDCTSIGDAYIESDATLSTYGHIMFLTNTGFIDGGEIRGPKGETGDTPEIKIVDDYWYINGENTGHTSKGADGKDGVDGAPGKDGVDGAPGSSISILDTTTTYAFSDDGYTPPTSDGSWLNSEDLTGSNSIDNNLGRYLWARTVISYNDGTENKTYLVTYLGTNGKDGTNGKSVNIKGTLDSVAKLPKEGNVENDGYIVNGYLWIYTGTTLDDYDSSNSDENAQYHNGFENVGQFTGINGQSACMHIAWANSLAPDYDDFITYSAFSDNSGIKYKYRGIYIDYSDDPSTCKDPTTPSLYKWTDISGEKGEDGVTIVVDLSEELVYVNLDSDGNTTTDYSFTTTLSMFLDYGATESPLTINSVEPTFAGTKLDREGKPSFSVTVSEDTTATNPKTTYNITIPKGVKATSFNIVFNVSGVDETSSKTYTRNTIFKVICIPVGKDGEDSVSYTLKPSVSTIYKYTSNGEVSYSPATISCSGYKQVGGSAPIVVCGTGVSNSVNTEGNIHFFLGSSNTATDYTSTLTVAQISGVGDVESIKFEYVVDGKIWDYDTVYIQPGPSNLTLVSEKTKYYYSTSLSPTATPTNWSETPIEGIAGQYIWTKIVYTWTDGTNETTTEIITYSRCGTGVDAIKADLDNESDYIMVGEDKILELETPITTTTNATLYKGADALLLKDGKCTISIPTEYQNFVSGTIALSSNKKSAELVFTISSSIDKNDNKLVLDNKGCNITITLVADDDNSTTRTINYSLVWVPAGEDGVFYRIQPSVNVIKKYTNNDPISFSVNDLTCSVLKSVGLGSYTKLTSSDLINAQLKLFYTLDGLDEHTYEYVIDTTTLVPINSTISGTTETKFIDNAKFVLKYNDLVVDNETVLIVQDGMNGSRGTNGKTLISTFKGTYTEDTLYTGTEDDKYIRVDIVYYQGEDESDGKYYMTNSSKNFTNTKGSDTGLPNATDSQYWMEFQGQYANIATGLLFTEHAIIENATIRSLKTADEGERIETSGNKLISYDKNNVPRINIDPEDEEAITILNSSNYNQRDTNNCGYNLILPALCPHFRYGGTIIVGSYTYSTQKMLENDAKMMAIQTGDTYDNIYVILENGKGTITVYMDDSESKILNYIKNNISGQISVKEGNTEKIYGIDSTLSGGTIYITYSNNGMDPDGGDAMEKDAKTLAEWTEGDYDYIYEILSSGGNSETNPIYIYSSLPESYLKNNIELLGDFEITVGGTEVEETTSTNNYISIDINYNNYAQYLNKLHQEDDIKILSNIILSDNDDIDIINSNSKNISNRYNIQKKSISFTYKPSNNYATGLSVTSTNMVSSSGDITIYLSIVFKNKQDNTELEFPKFFIYKHDMTAADGIWSFTTPFYSGQTINSIDLSSSSNELYGGIYDIYLRPYVSSTCDMSADESAVYDLSLFLNNTNGILFNIIYQGRTITIHNSGISIVYNSQEYFQLGFKNISPSSETNVQGLDVEMYTKGNLMKMNKLEYFFGNADLYKNINFYRPGTGYGIVDISNYKSYLSSVTFTKSNVKKLSALAVKEPIYLQTWMGVAPIRVIGDETNGYSLSAILSSVDKISESDSNSIVTKTDYYFLITTDGKIKYTFSQSTITTTLPVYGTTYIYNIPSSDSIYLRDGSTQILEKTIIFPKTGTISEFVCPTISIYGIKVNNSDIVTVSYILKQSDNTIWNFSMNTKDTTNNIFNEDVTGTKKSFKIDVNTEYKLIVNAYTSRPFGLQLQATPISNDYTYSYTS